MSAVVKEVRDFQPFLTSKKNITLGHRKELCHLMGKLRKWVPGLHFTGGSLFLRFLTTHRQTQTQPNRWLLVPPTKLSHEVRPLAKSAEEKATDSQCEV